MAECGDDEHPLSEDDEDEYYIINRGAIGETDDNGESVSWLYLPLDHKMESMPERIAR